MGATESAVRVVLKPKEERRILQGHLWVFSNEIAEISGSISNGALVSLFSHKNECLGTGFYNKNSLIAVRLISAEQSIDIGELFKLRFKQAFDLRKSLFPTRDSFRMIFSESDFLPGLIIDKYNSTFVLQINSAGMEYYKDIIVSLLIKEYAAKNVFSMHDEYFRALEGLPTENLVYHGEKGIEVISDGDILYKIDFSNTQKTGFFFDQVANRKYIESLVDGRSVLDAFCNSGGFGLHAIKSGASKVVFIDSSNQEMQNVEQNLVLNAISDAERYELQCGDVFDYLQSAIASGKKFDIVLIDPPAFAKNKKAVQTAIKGYEKLHKLALSALHNGGFLVTTSCSHHISNDDFFFIARQAAFKTNTAIQLLYSTGASPDHPVLLSMPETQYLKFAVYRKL